MYLIVLNMFNLAVITLFLHYPSKRTFVLCGNVIITSEQTFVNKYFEYLFDFLHDYAYVIC
jgi:hypothetical protein